MVYITKTVAILVFIMAFNMAALVNGQACNPPCLHNGQCLNGEACFCEGTGYDGAQCEVPRCDPVCFAGTCYEPNKCNCTGTGYSGPICDKITCEKGCVHGSCTSPNLCECQEGWTGESCAEALCPPFGCENNGVCSSPGKCDCKGWEGERCQIPICDVCYHGSTCVGNNVCNCSLATGWTGQRCEVDIKECQTKGVQWCDPLTRCINTVGSYNCTACPAGYGGDGKTGCVPVCPLGCDNGGVCSGPNTCDCTGTGFTGPTCFQDFDECAAGGFCDRHLQCTNTLGSFKCEGNCPANFTGDATSGCVAICNTPCENGDCTEPNVCTCKKGWTGELCQTGGANSVMQQANMSIIYLVVAVTIYASMNL